MLKLHGISRRPPLIALVVFFFCCLLIVQLMAFNSLSAATPDFGTDVMAVLSKAGCNMGACHGNLNGKGGLQLSLRGQDPEHDYRQLTRQHGSRRVDVLDPDGSLVLLKPTGQLAHEGGVRFEQDSPFYQILHDWIAAGAAPPLKDTAHVEQLEVSPPEAIVMEPQRELKLQVTACLSDGSCRDVTQLAVYEPSNMLATVSRDGLVQREDFGETTILVRYLDKQRAVRVAFIDARPDYVWPGVKPLNYIDVHIFAKLQELRMYPSELADDATFVRRAYLDALGLLPTAEEARAFVQDARPDKRDRLIDQLLVRPEFAEHWALNWSDILRNEEKVLDTKGVELFYDWMRQSMAEGKPLDQFVRELVASCGSTYKNPPANYYRAMRDPALRSETTARLFLGVRLQCAQCHNHPFDRWTQEDYYSWAANFSGIEYEIVENNRKDKLDKHEFVGEQIVKIQETAELKNPSTDQNAVPRYLGIDQVVAAKGEQRLDELAKWLTSHESERFASVLVNFIWYHTVGRGLVEPIDDFRTTNPPVNEPLLEALAEDFVAHGYDLRHLVRTIMNSRSYQASSVPERPSAGDDANFARGVIRRLTAEELLDAQCQVLDTAADFAGYDARLRAGQMPGVRGARERRQAPEPGDRFLIVFGKPERLMACECERSKDPNAPDFRLPELSLPSGLSVERLERRRQMMRLIDQQSRMLEFSAEAAGFDQYYDKALAMLTSPRVRGAFDLAAEPDHVREKYGRTTYGQSCLLARRLVEAGVRFVTVYFSNSIGGRSTESGGWDTHGFDNTRMYKIVDKYHLPLTDQTLPTLLDDLDERGLLEETLVLWMGEFGRTPKINDNESRDHWPQCYTALLAGGGVKRGYVYGKSDARAMYPDENPVRPEDLAATLYYLLGIDPHSEIYDRQNRPLAIAGNPVLDVIA